MNEKLDEKEMPEIDSLSSPMVVVAWDGVRFVVYFPPKTRRTENPREVSWMALDEAVVSRFPSLSRPQKLTVDGGARYVIVDAHPASGTPIHVEVKERDGNAWRSLQLQGSRFGSMRMPVEIRLNEPWIIGAEASAVLVSPKTGAAYGINLSGRPKTLFPERPHLFEAKALAQEPNNVVEKEGEFEFNLPSLNSVVVNLRPTQEVFAPLEDGDMDATGKGLILREVIKFNSVGVVSEGWHED